MVADFVPAMGQCCTECQLHVVGHENRCTLSLTASGLLANMTGLTPIASTRTRTTQSESDHVHSEKERSKRKGGNWSELQYTIQ
jgi:hypothetical protein